MKNIILFLVLLVGCSQQNSSNNVSPDLVEFEATDEVLQGKGDYGDLTSGTKLLTFAIKNMGTEPLVGPAILEDSSNFKIIYQNNCLTVLPTKTCSVKVNFDTSGKAPGSYTTKLNLDRVFVSLSANVVAPVASGSVEFKSGSTVITSQDFGVLTDIQSVQKTITVKNATNQSQSLPVSLSTADFNIVYDTCNNKPVAVGATCQIKINLSGAGKTGPLNANLIYGSYSLPLSAVINSTASGNIEYYTSSMLVEEINYGEVNPSQNFLKTITIKNTGLVPVSYPVIVTGNGYNLIYDMCTNKNIPPQGTCIIKINYIVPNMTGENNATVAVNSVVLDLLSNVVIPPPPEVTKIALTNFNPNNGIVNFGNVEQYSGETAIKSMTIRNLSGAIQKFTEAPLINNYTIVSNGCLNVNINRNAYCSISFKFNSDGKNIQNYDEVFLMENATHKIEFQLKSNVIASSSVIACDMNNATAGGGVDNSNGKVLEVQGNFPLCTVKTCDALYQVSGDAKSCVPVTVDCTALDATANGVNFTNSNSTVKGQVVAGDVSQCLLADTACNLNYVRNVSGKTCDEEVRPCLESDAVANGVNISNVNSSLVPPYLGNVVAGNVSACVINQCVSGYTKDGAGKVCIQDSRGCTGADIIGLGGNTANALTYSGQVVMNDPSACKIATCSGTYEPSTSGLICENKVMSSLTFTIANKNSNGYVKDSFLQLNSNTINALEMKISDNNNCTSGTWEPFVASKQFAIPAIRLNGSVDVPVSIQYRRNTTTSTCVYVSGAISLVSSHNYRHDNIAPPTLTINTYTNNQDISVSSLNFSGNCTSGINRETGLFGQALTSAACGGTYTSQSIATATDGFYPLYVKQTDLAGNTTEVTVNVRKITSCNASNAVSGGVRSTSGALTYSGNLTDGCLIATCDSYTNLAGDAKSCDDKAIVGGSFLISKNTNGYINTSSVTLTSISATNAKTFDIFENATCASTPRDSNITYTTTRAYTPSSLNHSSDQAVSILFKNGTQTKCVHVAGAITLTSANTYRHDNIAPSPLTISSPINGSTTVNSSVTLSGNCDSSVVLMSGFLSSETTTTCSGSYSKVMSIPSDGVYTFKSYQTDLAGNTSQASVSITRNTSKNLTINKSGVGVVTSSPSGINCGGSCSYNFANGQSVVLTATPDVAYTFTGWSGACSGTSTCSLTMNSNLTATATFTAKPTFQVNVTKVGTGTVTGGTINCGAICSQSTYSGSSITLTATPDQTTTFTGWSGACTGTSTCVLSNITSVKNVTATFTNKPQYTLTVSKTGAGIGTVSGGNINCGGTCSQTVYSGTQITLSAVADAESSFAGWSGGGCSGTGTCVTTITASTTVTANFTPLICANPTETLIYDNIGGLAKSDNNFLYNVSQQGILKVAKTTYSTTFIPNALPEYSSWTFAPLNGDVYIASGNIQRVSGNSVTTLNKINISTYQEPMDPIILGVLGDNVIIRPTYYSGNGISYGKGLYYINKNTPNNINLVPGTVSGGSFYTNWVLMKTYGDKMYLKVSYYVNGASYPAYTENLILNSNMTIQKLTDYADGPRYVQTLSEIAPGYMILKMSPHATSPGYHYSAGIYDLDSYIVTSGISEIKATSYTYKNEGVVTSLNDTYIKAPQVINKIGNPVVIGNRIYGGFNEDISYPAAYKYAQFCTGVYNLEYQNNQPFTDSDPQCFTLYNASFTQTFVSNNFIYAEWLPPTGFIEFNGKIYFGATYGTRTAIGSQTNNAHAKKIFYYTPGGGTPTAVETTANHTILPYYASNYNTKPIIVGENLYYINQPGNSGSTYGIMKITKANVASTLTFKSTVFSYNGGIAPLESSPSPEQNWEPFIKYKNEAYFEHYNYPDMRNSLLKIDINGNLVEAIPTANTGNDISRPFIFDGQLFYYKTPTGTYTSTPSLYKMQCN